MKYMQSAQAGNIVQCPNGHDLYKIMRDVTAGLVMEGADFEPIGDAAAPQESQKIGKCHVCGIPWIVPAPGGGYVFSSIKRRVEL